MYLFLKKKKKNEKIINKKLHAFKNIIYNSIIFFSLHTFYIFCHKNQRSILCDRFFCCSTSLLRTFPTFSGK